jgi:AraC-like DNA-binding protein
MHSEPSPLVSRFSDPAELISAIKGSSLAPFQLSPTPAPSLMARLPGERLCLDYAAVGPSMVFTGLMAEDCYTLVFVMECPEPGVAFNYSIGIERGYLGFFPPGGIIDSRTPAGFSTVALTIPASRFLTVQAIYFPDMPEDVLQRGTNLIVGAVEESRLRRLASEVTDRLISETGWQGAMSVSQQMEEELLEAFFAALRSGCAVRKRSDLPTTSRRQRHLHRAREFIAAHGHRPVALEELCGELGLTARSVQQIFQSLLQVSPVTYLRHHRLQGVRRALQSAQPELGAVKSAALDWGFWHLGRFAADYRTLFGESPHETLGSRHDPAA